jgi:hypothetical protein
VLYSRQTTTTPRRKNSKMLFRLHSEGISIHSSHSPHLSWSATAVVEERRNSLIV